ncbi:DUF5709 domain-containing protein [Streptomyces sp. NPDC088785]|uniref:DUF5709 domain-containing protein n=1 Tax=Streptomyces sp. NPDC088785 TaxID=3365897 RepID=UPI00382179C6
MSENDAFGDDVYQPDGSEVQDDEGLLDAADTLMEGVEDPLDEGYSPPERFEGRYDTEPESLDERLAEEVPDVAAPSGDGLGDTDDTDGELLDAEVGDARSGRLVAEELDADGAGRESLTATDAGIDGAGASAEEAAVHLIDDENG